MAQDVEPGRRRHLRRHRPRVVGIEIAERRLEPAVGDAGLRLQLLVVEDGHAGRLAAGPRRRRNRDQRLQRTGHRQPLADRRVHVVEKIGRRIGGVEIDRLRRVDHRAAADGDERVERPRLGERDGVEKRLVARLDAHAVVDRVRNLVLLQRLEHRPHRRQLREHRIGHDQHELRAHLGQVHADFARHADAEAHAGDGHLERDVFGHAGQIIIAEIARRSDHGVDQSARRAVVEPGALRPIRPAASPDASRSSGANTPVSGARVSLFPAGRPSGPIGPPPQAISDQDGRFVFDRVSPGTYRLDAQKSGFAPHDEAITTRDDHGRRGPVDGRHAADAEGAAITGKVIDPKGEPLTDARVVVLRRMPMPAGGARGLPPMPRLMPVPSPGAQTNDLGEFRVFGLAPGEYFVAVTPRSVATFRYGRGRSRRAIERRLERHSRRPTTLGRAIRRRRSRSPWPPEPRSATSSSRCSRCRRFGLRHGGRRGRQSGRRRDGDADGRSAWRRLDGTGRQRHGTTERPVRHRRCSGGELPGQRLDHAEDDRVRRRERNRQRGGLLVQFDELRSAAQRRSNRSKSSWPTPTSRACAWWRAGRIHGNQPPTNRRGV